MRALVPSCCTACTQLGCTKAFRRKLDGVQARGFFKILGVPHSYLSRVSNMEVLEQAAAKILMHRHLQLIGRIAALPASDVM